MAQPSKPVVICPIHWTMLAPDEACPDCIRDNPVMRPDERQRFIESAGQSVLDAQKKADGD